MFWKKEDTNSISIFENQKHLLLSINISDILTNKLQVVFFRFLFSHIIVIRISRMFAVIVSLLPSAITAPIWRSVIVIVSLRAHIRRCVISRGLGWCSPKNKFIFNCFNQIKLVKQKSKNKKLPCNLAPRSRNSITNFQRLGTQPPVPIHRNQTVFLFFLVSESHESIAFAEPRTVQDDFCSSNRTVFCSKSSVEWIIVNVCWKIAYPNTELSLSCWFSCCTRVVQSKTYRLKQQNKM